MNDDDDVLNDLVQGPVRCCEESDAAIFLSPARTKQRCEAYVENSDELDDAVHQGKGNNIHEAKENYGSEVVDNGDIKGGKENDDVGDEVGHGQGERSVTVKMYEISLIICGSTLT